MSWPSNSLIPSNRRGRGSCRFTFDADDMVRYRDLSGVSLAVQVACRRQSFSHAMLFTHRGISRSGNSANIFLLAPERCAIGQFCR